MSSFFSRLDTEHWFQEAGAMGEPCPEGTPQLVFGSHFILAAVSRDGELVTGRKGDISYTLRPVPLGL